MTRSRQFIHGNHLHIDTHLDNGSMRIVKPKYAFDLDNNPIVPVPEDTISVITPENNPHWEDWYEKAHPVAEAEFRSNWDSWQHDPDVQYKVDQIKRACPGCREALNA